MASSRFSIAREDEELRELVGKTAPRVLAAWAIACAERVLPYFEDELPRDCRPRQALATLAAWVDTGVFRMEVIRGAALAAHAAAREAGAESPARSAARAAGQAVATAHVPRHAYGAAIYAQQAIYRATNAMDAAATERNWQYQRLAQMRANEKE